MRDITARGYVVSRLTREQVDVLHRRERELGYSGTPHMIRVKFGLDPIGDIPEPMFQKTESQCIAVYEKERGYYRDHHRGCCFPLADGNRPRSDAGCSMVPDLVVLHDSDIKIRNDGIPFPTPSAGGRAAEKVKIERRGNGWGDE